MTSDLNATFVHRPFIKDRREASLRLSLPRMGKGDRDSGDRGLSFILDLRRISPLVFHTASTLSGSLRSPPSPRGEGFVRRYSFSLGILYSL